MVLSQYKSKKQQIIDLCDALEFPIFFPEDIHVKPTQVILNRSDGYTLIYSVVVRPTLINDNSMIELDTKITATGYHAAQNLSSLGTD